MRLLADATSTGQKQNTIAGQQPNHNARARNLTSCDATPRAGHRNHACCNDAAQSHKEDAKNCTDAAPDAAGGALRAIARALSA